MRERGGPHPPGDSAGLTACQERPQFLSPTLQGIDDRPQGLALPGEAVLDPGRHLGIGGPRQQPELLQFTQPGAEDFGGRAGDQPRQFPEPSRPVHQVVEDEQRPLGADDRQGALDWAVVPGRGSGEGTQVSVGRTSSSQCPYRYFPFGNYLLL